MGDLPCHHHQVSFCDRSHSFLFLSHSPTSLSPPSHRYPFLLPPIATPFPSLPSTPLSPPSRPHPFLLPPIHTPFSSLPSTSLSPPPPLYADPTRYLSSVYLTESSLSQDVSQFDFSTGTQVSSIMWATYQMLLYVSVCTYVVRMLHIQRAGRDARGRDARGPSCTLSVLSRLCPGSPTHLEKEEEEEEEE